MSEIKKGDLVMCRLAKNRNAKPFAGAFRVVGGARFFNGTHCFALVPRTAAKVGGEVLWVPGDLKKIDPPSTGEYDRVPVRKTEPETA